MYARLVDAHRDLTLRVSPTRHTAAAVVLLRAARAQLPCAGSICAGLDRADPGGTTPAAVYVEAVAALDVAARVFGIQTASWIGALQPDAAYVFDVAVYHLTGAGADAGPALKAFARAAGPLLDAPG